MTLRYLSVCSGIEAATQAWHPLGWKPVAFSEIEAFPSAVLEHHYPDVPNWGDMTKFQDWPDADVDVLCGGTPCQSFSVAGLRQGLADPRGNLMLTFGAIARRHDARWVVWENVPGVLSSNGGRDFAAFLGLLGQLGYGWAYRVLDAQHVRTRRFPFAVPQRRRRVFVVGYLGDWRRAAAVLFDRESLSGHPAPRREARERVAPTISARPTGGGGLGTDFDLDGGLVANSGNVGYCLTASAQQSLDAETETETETLIAVAPFAPSITSNPYGDHESRDGLLVAHALRREGFDASEDGTGRGTPIIAFQNRTRGDDGRGYDRPPAVSDGVVGTLETVKPWHVAFNSREDPEVTGERAGPLGASLPQAQAVAFDMRGREGGAMPEGPHETANIRAADGGSSRSYVAEPWAVRRLTPVECERLQGFPDEFTRIPYRGKPAENCPDGPRYKALGNSWAVNVAEWVGERINEVDTWQ